MKREYSKAEIDLVEAIVGLFIILPNPELKDKKDEVMKIALQVLDDMMDKKAEDLKDDTDYTDDDYDSDDALLEEIMEELFKEKLKK